MRGAAQILGLLLVTCCACTNVTDPRLGDGGDGGDGGLDAAQPDAGVDAAPLVEELCWELIAGMEREEMLALEPRMTTADVFFLVDNTASMQDEADQLRDGLRDAIIPGIAAAIADVHFAVGTFADFPVEPFGDVGAGDVPFALLSASTDDLAAIESAVGAIRLGNGRDEAESLVEALYLSATGEGMGTFVSPASCSATLTGHPCFRPASVPVFVVFTDAPTHEGPGGSNPYTGVTPVPHSFEDAMAELSSAGVRVVGLRSGDGGALADLSAIGTATYTLRSDGSPIVIDIGRRGENLGTSVVAAITDLVDEVSMRVALSFEDVDGDGEDAATWFAAPRLDRVDPPEALIAEIADLVEVSPHAQMRWAVSVQAPPTLPDATQRVRIVLREQAGSEVAAAIVTLPDLAVGCP